MKTKLLSLFLLLFVKLFLAQTTLLEYPFNNQSTYRTPSVNNTGVAYNTTSIPMQYYNSAGTAVNPTVTNSGIGTADEGSYLELTFNTQVGNFSGINVAWSASLTNTVFGSGRWTLQEYVGGTWESRGSIDLGFLNYNESDNFLLSSNADNNPAVRIRIVAEEVNSFWAQASLNLDDLLITSRSPKINIFGYNTSNNLQQIPVNSPAATIYGTDFGMVITSSATATGYSDKTFRVQNNGASTLNVSGINFAGLHPGDFAVQGATNFSVNAGATRDFVVRFNATDDGVRSALLNITSNASPSPYSYYVEGRGTSCNTVDVALKTNNMEAGAQSLPATPESSFDKVTGNSRGSTTNPNNLGIRLYGPVDNTNYNLFTSGNSSWYVKGRSSTVNFGPVDVSNEKGIFITFNLAAFGTGDNIKFNSGDTVALEVLKPNTTDDWSREILISGTNSDNADNSRFSFTAGATAFEATYDGNNEPVGGAQRYNKIKLKFLSTAGINDLVFRIVLTNNTIGTKLWLVDDVTVSTANAIYKTYVGGTGTGWRTAANVATTAPTIEEKAIIDANFTGNLTACECEVNANKTVTVGAGNVIRLQNKLVNNGNFIIQNNGNLIQVDNSAVNQENIEVQKLFTFSGGRSQFNYVSSPTVNTNVKSIYTGTLDNSLVAQYHNENTNTFANSSGAYIAGRALALKEPLTGTAGSTAANPAKFIGVPFNGPLNYPLAYTTNRPNVNHGYNLVGNPYPSNLDLVALYNANSSKIESTIRFWDNRGNTITEQQGSGYLGQSYAQLNASSGTSIAAAATPTTATPPYPARPPSRYVSPAQGFMVRALSTAQGQTLDFSNTNMRVSNTTTQFFGKNNDEQMDRYWLGITTPTEIIYSAAVVYYEGGANTVGPDDTKAGGSSDNIFTMADSERIAIHGRPVFTNQDVLGLGYRAFREGDYTISLQNSEGIFANGQAIYLKDKQTGTITNLSEGSYTFAAEASEQTGRFEILYKPETILATDGALRDELQVYRDGSSFVLRSPRESLEYVQVYDAGGRLILTVKGSRSREIRFDADRMAAGMYILKTGLASGETLTRKIRK